METDKIKSTIKKMENVFLKAGFEWQIINDERYLVYRENFCQITYVHGLSAYVIEATNNRREAKTVCWKMESCTRTTCLNRNF